MDINLIAPINNLGYGVASKNILLALDNLGHRVSLFPISGRERMQYSSTQAPAIEEALVNADRAHRINPRTPCIKIWHQNDMRFPDNYSGPKIGFPFFELDELSPVEVKELLSCDHVFVASHWAKSVLSTYGIKSYVVPLGVDTSIFKPTRNQSSGKFVYLNVGKWEVRKGHLDLAPAFAKAFEGNDNVELWMMCDNPFYSVQQNEWWHNYYRSYLGRKVKFIPRQYSELQVAGIMQRANAGVFPAKAEGWNLELLEMLACAKRVVATDYSGHTEFCDTTNSFLLPVSGFENAIDACELHPEGYWFKGNQGNWAKVNVDDLVSSLRSCYQSEIDFEPAALNTAKRFTWDNTAKTITEILHGIG